MISVSLGYLNADPWAVATDLTLSRSAVVRTLADKGDFPRHVVLEAALRYVEEDLLPRGP